MIKYELAKQLKEAGYPQGKHVFYKEGGILCTAIGNVPDPKTDAFIPSIDELIKECEKVPGYTYFNMAHCRDGWIALMKEQEGGLMKKGEINGEGDTPEEAVANLWLELNKN